jgi:hypothetical protein
MSVSEPADDVAISVDPLTASAQRKRAPKRAKRLAKDGGECVAPVSSEEKSFRVFFLSRETGIDPDQARELVDSIERDGAALVNAARRMKIKPND